MAEYNTADISAFWSLEMYFNSKTFIRLLGHNDRGRKLLNKSLLSKRQKQQLIHRGPTPSC